MPVPIGAIFGGLQLLSSFSSVLGGKTQLRRLMEERRQLLNDLSSGYDRDYNQLVANNARALYGSAGTLSDAVGSLGRNYGSQLAESGVTNSSTVAGAMNAAQRNAAMALSNQAIQSRANEMALLSAGKRDLINRRLGYNEQDYMNARQSYQGSQQGFASLLGTLGQQFFGPQMAKAIGPAMNGKNNGATSVLNTSPWNLAPGFYPSISSGPWRKTKQLEARDLFG